jgi:predicted dehydrogenase
VIGAFVSIPHTHIETWHPDPRAFYARGGGPVLDMGPYYVTALVGLLGPVVEVAAMSRIGANPRVMTSPDRVIDSIDVTVDTHAGALLRFAGGVLATAQMSFDVWNTGTPKIELYGTRGTLQIPDPNQYDGDVRFRAIDAAEWSTLPPIIPAFGRVGTDDQYLRGPGVADLARSLNGEPFRVDASLAAHVLDVLVGIEESADSREFVAVSSSVSRPAAVTAPAQVA